MQALPLQLTYAKPLLLTWTVTNEESIIILISEFRGQIEAPLASKCSRAAQIRLLTIIP